MKRYLTSGLALLLALCVLLAGCVSPTEPTLSGGGTTAGAVTTTVTTAGQANGTTAGNTTTAGSVADGQTTSGTNGQSGNTTTAQPPAGGTTTTTGAQSSDELPFDPTIVQPNGIPAYTGATYVYLNNNQPSFSATDKASSTSFERYAALDALGRCGAAFACVGRDIMPTGDRGDIGSVIPTGWVSVKYDIVSGKYLYNRSHLIGWQLTGEDANERNLITGTRYFNVDGMLPFENMVADYVRETGNHVLYRVTPMFVGNNLLASGVKMEAYSVEDDGEGICFNVYVYNVQPGVDIDYATGESRLIPVPGATTTTTAGETVQEYILNTNSKKFHYPDCASAKKIGASNRKTFTGLRSELIADGYIPCMNCEP